MSFRLSAIPVFIFAALNIKSEIIGSFLPLRTFIFSCLCLLLLPAMAQVKFSAKPSTRDMGKADYVEIQFVVENAKEIGNLQPPELNDFTIIQGPSQSTGMSIVNGNMTQYRGISYLLQPKKTGTLLIKSATATIDGQVMHTNPIQILVHNTPGQSGRAPGFSPLPDPAWPPAQPSVEMDEVVRPGENIAEKIHRNFFIKVDVNKTDCFLGEPIVATYKLYARLRSDSRVTRHPSLNGFSVFDMIDPTDDRVSVEKVNGKNFSVHIIRKVQLIPLQAGEVTLDPVELDNNIYFIKTDGSSGKNSSQGLGGLLDRLFEPEVNGTPFTQHIVLLSKPVSIHVKPLPEAGRPADFNGAVGNYSIRASIDSRAVDTGDAAKLAVVIKGTGNLPVINAPVVNWPSEMESYDVNTKENIEKTVIPLGGSKTYTYSFVTNKPGKYVLPPVKLSYFDPASHIYKSIETDTLRLQVNASVQKKRSKPVTQPVQVIKTDWTKYAWWGAAFFLLACTTIFIIRESKKDARLKEEKARAMAALEKAKATPIEVDPLEESRNLMMAGDFSKFYGSVNRAIWKTVSDKLKLPASELNKLNIASGLRTHGWSDEEIIQLKNLLNECEMKLYTPEYSTSDMQRILFSAEEICIRLKA